MSHKQLTFRQMMNRIYKNICGYEIDKSDEKLIRKFKGSPIYGEITQKSVEMLYEYLSINKDDVLYDLGSGVGKVVLQVAIKTPIKKAIGIEISKERYDGSLQALSNAKNFFNSIDKKVKFINDSLLNIDLKNASIIYTCSTAFSQGFMKEMTNYLGLYKHPFRLVSLQELPDNKLFKLEEVLKLDMSWIKKTSVHVYQRLL